MSLPQEPVVGSWYLNQAGKLMKVKFLLYSERCLSKVMIEFLDGTLKTVDIAAWNYLDLDVKTRKIERHNEARDY